MKILIYSPPFAGHLNVLWKMMEENKEMDFKLVITGWDNFSIDGAVNLGRSTLRDTDPALWTFPRVCELMDDSLKVARDYKPDLIIYDFFSLEGYFTGKLLGIPCWCSIPAMIGPNDKVEYLQAKLNDKVNQEALGKLRDKYGIEVDYLEMVSDGFHIPGDVNLIWSYKELTPPKFMEGRKSSTYCFVGNYNKRIPNNKEIIYFSLGTVVMNNLWVQQKETGERLKDFIAGIAEGLKDEKVIFVTQGKQVLDSYPETWQVEDCVNQVEMLSRSRVFITHGGGNGFHEAVLQRVPMVAIPFFGDQILVGHRIAELGIGINLGTDDSIDTKKSKKFLDKGLVRKTVDAVKEILSNPAYQERVDQLKLTKSSLKNVIEKHLEVQKNG